MPADVVDLLTEDHRKVRHLIDRLMSGKGDRLALLDEAGRLLVAHTRAEGEGLHAILAERLPGGERRVRREARADDRTLELYRLVKGSDPGDEGFDDLLTRFAEAVRRHVEVEEREVLPVLRSHVGDQQRAELGAAFDRRREETLRGQGAGGAERPGGPTRDELYRRARERDIPGRSRMSKRELADALGNGG